MIYLLLAAGLSGLIVGSFLNVVVYRLPFIMQREWEAECRAYLKLPAEQPKPKAFNLAVPASHCPHCEHKLRWYDNIPLVSYLLLGGKCAYCQRAIALRYPLLEFTSAVLAIIIANHFGYSWQTPVALIFTWSLLVLFCIDLEHQLLPDIVTLPLVWLGLIVNLFAVFVPIEKAVLGVVIGYSSLWLIAWIFQRITGKVGMGHGDFKLLALLGAWLGWQALPFVVLFASLLGSVVGLILLGLKRHSRDIPIPFGPYLALAGWSLLLWGGEWTQLYWQLFHG